MSKTTHRHSVWWTKTLPQVDKFWLISSNQLSHFDNDIEYL